MASGFSSGGGGAPNIFNSGGISGRSMMGGLNNGSYRSPLAGILPEQTSQILQQGRPDLIGKRSLFEFQQQQQHQQQQQQQLQQQNQLLAQLHQQQQQQQQNLNLYLRNVKPRIYQHASPISPLSSTDLSASLSPEVSSISSTSSASNARYGLPIFQQLRAQQIFSAGNANGINSSSSLNHPYFSTVSHPNLLPNRGSSTELVVRQDPEKKLMNRLQELEKQLLDDNEFDEGDAVSAVTNSEWSETIQNLIIPAQKPAISPSPTSSSSSCSSAQAVCPKQVIMEVACAISEGKKEAAVEVLTRLNSSSMTNVKGTTEQRLTAYVTSALRRRVNLTDYPSHSPISQLYSKEHAVSTQMLYEASPCFKLGFMAANLALMQTISDQIHSNKLQLHVVDFDIGQGGQYVQLLDALAATKSEKPIMLKISTSAEFITGGGGVERLNAVGESLKMLANKVGVEFEFNVLNMGVRDLSLESLGVEENDVLAVNFAFLLYRLPDESVTTENLRDELLRRVKGWSPKVVTVVEQEMNANTAAFAARVNEACGYYGALFDSLDSTGPREGSDRAKIEDGLGRRMSNSVACEGRDRVERCEVFGKWRARLSMAGFEPKPLSPTVADSLLEKLNSWTRGNPGFILKEQSGGICFGWSGRTLTVASAWH